MRFSLDSMYQEMARSPIGTQFQGPGGRIWVKTDFGPRPVGPKETARELVARTREIGAFQVDMTFNVFRYGRR